MVQNSSQTVTDGQSWLVSPMRYIETGIILCGEALSVNCAMWYAFEFLLSLIGVFIILPYSWTLHAIMMTSSNGSIFHVSGILWEFLGHRWIPLTYIFFVLPCSRGEALKWRFLTRRNINIYQYMTNNNIFMYLIGVINCARKAQLRIPSDIVTHKVICD